MTLAGRIAIGDAASSAERALPRHGESRSLRRMSIVLLLALSIPVSPCAVGFPPLTQDASTTQSPQEGDRMALFKDPKDGHFDTSRWLLDHRGFLPVPIVITDPAVGTGGGVALTFFHRPKGSAATRKTSQGQTRIISPNIYGAGAIRTSNGTKGYGGGAIMHFHEDRWRYRGALAKADINLDFYTPGTLLPSRQIGYNVDGVVSYQQVFRRLGEQDLYLGLAWIYMDLEIGFDEESDRGLFNDREL